MVPCSLPHAPCILFLCIIKQLLTGFLVKKKGQCKTKWFDLTVFFQPNVPACFNTERHIPPLTWVQSDLFLWQVLLDIVFSVIFIINFIVGTWLWCGLNLTCPIWFYIVRHHLFQHIVENLYGHIQSTISYQRFGICQTVRMLLSTSVVSVFLQRDYACGQWCLC